MFPRNIKWSLLDQLIVSGGAFLTVASCARFLSPDEQGKFGYVLTGYMAAVIFNMTAVFQWASVEAAGAQDKVAYRNELAVIQAGLALLFSVVATFLVVIAQAPVGAEFGIDVLALLGLFLFVQQLADFDRRAAYLLVDGMRAAKTSGVVYSLRIALLWAVQPTDVRGVLVLLTAAGLLPAAITMISAFKTGKDMRSVYRRTWMHIRNGRWFALSGPLVWLWSSLPVYMLGWFNSLSAVGAFITIRSLTNMANVALELLETHVAAVAGRLYPSDKAAFEMLFVRLLKIGLLVWGVALVVLFAVGKELLAMIYGEGYAHYEMVLTILWVATGVVFLFRQNAVKLRSMNAGHLIVQGYGVAILAMALCAFPLIKGYGIEGCAMLVLVGAAGNYLGQRMLARKFSRP